MNGLAMVWPRSGRPYSDGRTKASLVCTSIVSTALQSISSPSSKAQPRQKFWNSGPGNVVGWFTWNKAPWGRYFANTFLIAGVNTIGELITSVLAAYAFARINFKGKTVLFTILLATYMMPAEATLIPNYVMMAKPIPGQSPLFPILRLGLYDTYQAQILPFLASAVSIFLLRQQFLSVPNELHDAAKIDGAGHFRFLWSVVLPISVPALVTVAILSFYGSWNAFQWPLIVTSNPDIRPVQVGLNAFRAEAGSSYHLLMAAAAFVVAPIVLIYLVGQRYLVQGVARTGIRG